MIDAYSSSALLMLRWLHIFSAAVGLGVALLHPLLIYRLRLHWPNPELVHFFISIERWYIAPAHGLLVLSGFGMIYLSEMSISELWLATSILLMAIVICLHHLAFFPLLLQLNSAQFPQVQLQRLTWVSRLSGAMVLIILTLMIVQPGRS